MKTTKKTRRCYRCRLVKPLRDFGLSGWKKYQCTVCTEEGLRLWKEDHPLIGRYTGLKARSKRKLGAEVEILCFKDFETWYRQQMKDPTCFYCKANLEPEYEPGDYAFTIDRMENDKGYTLDNIIVACRRCNSTKSNKFSTEQMLEIANKYFLKAPQGA